MPRLHTQFARLRLVPIKLHLRSRLVASGSTFERESMSGSRRTLRAAYESSGLRMFHGHAVEHCGRRPCYNRCACAALWYVSVISPSIIHLADITQASRFSSVTPTASSARGAGVALSSRPGMMAAESRKSGAAVLGRRSSRRCSVAIAPPPTGASKSKRPSARGCSAEFAQLIVRYASKMR